MSQIEFEKLKRAAGSGDYDVAPIAEKLLADSRTPVEVLKILMNVSDHVFILESAEDRENWGRYTFLGYKPELTLTCTNGVVSLDGQEIKTDRPQAVIRDLLAKRRSPVVEGLPSFTGGLVGYFSYDYLKYPEPSLNLDAEDTEGFQDLDLMLFNDLICFDRFAQKILLITNISLTGNLEEEYKKGQQRLKALKELILRGQAGGPRAGRLKGEIRPYFSKDAYCGMVEKAKHYIKEGDIFQIVLSNRLEAPFEGSLLNTYRVLRTTNPSPYMFYFSGSEIEAAGASPETLVKLEDGVLHTFPLAGTRPRGKSAAEDEAIEKDLLADPKELAEHNMLVDLGRNDLGRVSKFGTVEVKTYHQVLKYSHVMHIGSTVRGEIREDLDAIDAIDSVLPAGTLSGAPKIRACQLINDLEGNKRGIYGGAVGYLDFKGNMDLCIAIRLAYKRNGKVFIRSGAGIVADSVPEKEYQECLNKAAAVVGALKQAGEVEE